MIENTHYSKELEMGVLGACINVPDAVGRIYGVLSDEMFYSDDNKVIYRTLREMYANTLAIDILTIAHQMIKRGVVLTSGNIPSELAKLSRQIQSANHLETHAGMIRELWQRRKTLELTNGAVDLSGDVRTGIIKLNEKLTEVLGTDSNQDWFTMSDMIYDLVKHQEAIASGEKKMVSSGLREVDRLNCGFSEGDMIVIGARPSVGKSALLLKMSTEMAKQGKRVGIISLEMNNNQVVARIASIDTGMDFKKIYNNLFYDQTERDLFLSKVRKNEFIGLPLFVSDKTRVDIIEIKTKALKLKNKHGCDVLMIDYLQLVSSDDSKSNREQEVAKISRGIKLMAMEMKIPVIVLVQLNRDVTKRSAKDRYPKLSDIRESGSLEQDADVVMMLHRDWPIGITENEDGSSTEFEADLLGVKWRNGQPFHMKLGFEPKQMKFVEKGTSWKPIPTDTVDHSEPIKEQLPF